MKKYIIFCYNITGMGGGQQFVYTKANYLIHQGYDVSVYSTIEGPIVIEGLQKYQGQIIKELKYPPCSFRKSKVNKTVSLIASKIEGLFEEILIESDGGYETQWAELVARKLNAQHIIFSVAEQQNKSYSKDYLDYLFFKYKRKELYGITRDSIRLLFKGYADIEDSEKYSFLATCSNVVDEYDVTPGYNLPKADYNIGGIWRTNKEGFVECMESILPFIRKHADKTFNIVIIGAGSEDNENRVKKLFNDLSNSNVIFMGFMYPIPKSLILEMDVFVSTAGSCRIPIRYGVPSISVTSAVSSDGAVQLYVLGILNYTTRNTVVPEETGCTTEGLLEKVLFECFCSTNPSLGMEKSSFDEEKELFEELSRFRGIELQHYDIGRIKAQLTIEKGYAFVGKSLGAKALFMADQIGHSLKNKR